MITIVLGKPGTGKSYHTVRYLANYITTLARKEKIERSIFTNLSIDLDALQRYCDCKRIKINISETVFKVDDSFLKYDETYLERGEKRKVNRGNKEFLEIDPKSKAFFWNRFPDNALIIIDEIQKYLSNIKEVGDSEEQSLVEYFSLHRHKRHDWIFLTQNLMSLSISVRRVSEKIVECLNSKQLTLPFPLSIPIRDIQTLLLGFGVQNQIYRVREGRLDGSYRVVYDGPIEPVVMRQEIFDLYQTHTLVASESVGVSSDSEIPFDLGRGAWRRALWWFVKKHWFHLTVKAICFYLAFKALCMFFSFLRSPDWLNLLGGDITPAVIESADDPALSQDLNSVEISELDIKSDENSEFFDFDVKRRSQAPIMSRVVLPGAVFENGLKYETGSITVDGRRIKDIDVRFGVTYEDPVIYYYNLYDDLDRFRRWLRYQQKQRALAGSNDIQY